VYIINKVTSGPAINANNRKESGLRQKRQHVESGDGLRGNAMVASSDPLDEGMVSLDLGAVVFLV